MNNDKYINELEQRLFHLERENEKLNHILKGSNDGFWHWDLLTDNLEYSECWFNMLGYKPNQLDNNSSLWKKLMHPEDLQRVIVFFETSLENENIQNYEIEFRLLHKDNYYLPVLSKGYIFRDKQGKAITVSGSNIHLTNQKLIENELRTAKETVEKSEKYFRSIFNESPILFWEEDFSDVKKYLNELKNKGVLDFYKFFQENPNEVFICAEKVKIIDVNNAVLETLEFSSIETLINNFPKTLTKVSIEKFVLALISSVEENFYFECITEHITSKQNLRKFYLKSFIPVDFIKDAARIIVSMVDITDLTEKEKELIAEKEKAEQNETKYKLIAENTSDGILVIDKNSKIQYISPNYTKILGYSEQEELSRDANSIYSLIHPEVRDNLYSNINKALEIKQTELLYTYRVKNVNGIYIWREDHAKFNYDNFGNHVNTYVICRDITERKNTEHEIRKLYKAIESSKTSIVVTDNNGIIEYANPYFSELTGFLPEEYIGKNSNLLKTNFHTSDYYKDFWNRLKSGSTWEGEFYNRKKNGEFYWEYAIISPVINGQNEITHFVGIKTDITESKRVANELITAKEKAEESDRLKSAFLQNMSHEVRTPLNAIQGFSQLLTKELQSSEKIKKFSDIISVSSNKLIDIISDVIEISQIQAKLISVKTMNFDFIQIINEIIQEFKPKIESKKIEFIVEPIISNKEHIILSDKIKIHKILKHLIDNAIKFTEKGQVIIEFDLQPDKIQFVVTDTGIGISKEMQHKIFEPFRQIEIGMCRNYGGNGLGLSIVKSYTEMLNGEVKLQSEPNIGTSISVSLPVIQIFSEKKLINNNQKQRFSSNIILIVEDEQSNFEYLAELLSDTNAKIIHATNGQKAIDICREEKQIDFILMDIKMPIMDGHTATKLIKAFRPDLPIIAQTAYALDSDKEKFLESGFDDYICKPIQVETLFATIEKYINR